VLAINKIIEFGKVPRKMLNGRLHVAVWTSGGIGGKKQLCANEIALNSSKTTIKPGESVEKMTFD